MDKTFLKDWATQLNISLEKLNIDFDVACKELESLSPNQTEEILCRRAQQKIKVQYRRGFTSPAKTYVGMIIGNDGIRDNLAKMRENQIERFLKAKEKATQTSNNAILQEVLDAKIVRLDDVGNPVALWPKLKKDGQPNKQAGKDMPSFEENKSIKIYGFCTPSGEKAAKGFELELKGKAVNQELMKGKLVSFKALDNSNEEDGMYSLHTNNTEFLVVDKTVPEYGYMTEGLTTLGLPKLITMMFQKNVIFWKQLTAWKKSKEENPHSNPIPEKFKNLVIIPDCLCEQQDFSGNKGRIKLNISNYDSSEIQDMSVLCLADMSLDKAIDFAPGSKVIAIGRLWIPDPKEDGSVNIVLMTSGMYAYSLPNDDWRIPRITNAEPIDESKLFGVGNVKTTSGNVVQKSEQGSKPVSDSW